METYFSKKADILLKERHLTQAKMCELLGMGKSNWANLVKTNNLEQLSKIADILGLPLEEVIGLNRKKYTLSGFVKVNQKTFEIESKADVEDVLAAINFIEEKEAYSSE